MGEEFEHEVIDRWTNSPASDADGREKLYLTLKLLHRGRLQLTSVVESGKLAKATLAQRARQALTGRKPSAF